MIITIMRLDEGRAKEAVTIGGAVSRPFEDGDVVAEFNTKTTGATIVQLDVNKLVIVTDKGSLTIRDFEFSEVSIV